MWDLLYHFLDNMFLLEIVVCLSILEFSKLFFLKPSQHLKYRWKRSSDNYVFALAGCLTVSFAKWLRTLQTTWNVPVHTCPCMLSTPRPTTCLHTMKLFSLLDLYVSQVSCNIFESIILNIYENESLFSHSHFIHARCKYAIIHPH